MWTKGEFAELELWLKATDKCNVTLAVSVRLFRPIFSSAYHCLRCPVGRSLPWIRSLSRSMASSNSHLYDHDIESARHSFSRPGSYGLYCLPTLGRYRSPVTTRRMSQSG